MLFSGLQYAAWRITLPRFLEHRIADSPMLRIFGRSLTAGVVENGKKPDARAAAPQGAVISPLLASIYSYYVFDLAEAQSVGHDSLNWLSRRVGLNKMTGANLDQR